MRFRHALLLAFSLSSAGLGSYLVWHNVFVRPSQCVERADWR